MRWLKSLSVALTSSLIVFGGSASIPARAADQGATAAATNDSPAWMVRVAVDRRDRVYSTGEFVNVSVVSEQAGYLYLFNVDASKAATQLFPNRFQEDNRIGARAAVVVPGRGGFRIRVGSRGLGIETLFAVVSKRPLNLKAEEFSREGPTPLAAERFTQLLAEATLGRTDLKEGLLGAREELRRRDPDEYARRARDYAEHAIQIRTVAARQPSRPKRVGLFVGISRYPNVPAEIAKPLRYAHRDAERMAEAARQVGDFMQRILLTDSSATLANIRAAFDQLVASTSAGDTVLIYWSGHGGRASTSDARKPYHYFLLPTDVLADAMETVFEEDEFGRRIQSLDGRKVMVIIDACFSGGHIEGAKTMTMPSGDAALRTGGNEPSYFLDGVLLRARSIGQRDAAVLAACRLEQTSLESERLQSGLMTHFMLGTLLQATGPLTLRRVYDEVGPKVCDALRGTPREGTQTPVFSDHTPPPPALMRP
ncbi:MAG: caspase family protein [Isosphaeraceae bacterium]